MTVTNHLSVTNRTCTNLTCANLYSFINTSIITQCINYNSSVVNFINTSIVNLQSNLLGTAYYGARIILWPGGTLSTSTDWYGLGVNNGTILYHAPTSAKHLFQN